MSQRTEEQRERHEGLLDRNPRPRCAYCNGYHAGACPAIRAIEYHENGTIKRVEYRDRQE